MVQTFDIRLMGPRSVANPSLPSGSADLDPSTKDKMTQLHRERTSIPFQHFENAGQIGRRKGAHRLIETSTPVV